MKSRPGNWTGWMLLALCCALGQPRQAVGRDVYRWVDDHGVVHYGDQVPPQYATRERDVVNSEGVVVQRMAAQKTPEQIAAEQARKRAIEEKASRDRNLLNTYVSVQEIEHLRDQRLALLADQIKVTSQFLDILNGRLARLRENSMHFQPYSHSPHAQPMPDQLADDLVRVTNDIHTQQQNLAEKHSEEAAMREQFSSDIQRFKELKGIH
ncbi:MAG: DUF4124 domain-containing protein [Gammaproteobacteria bacterium]|nr:DUF4124 domain-containing protein [Gammaproteobacteria bacterium]MDE2350090.1 DUF4124 domain-containing protein [Gammaproteobacteria bacterium]